MVPGLTEIPNVCKQNTQENHKIQNMKYIIVDECIIVVNLVTKY